MKTHAKVGGLVALITALAVSTAGCGRQKPKPIDSFFTLVSQNKSINENEPGSLNRDNGNYVSRNSGGIEITLRQKEGEYLLLIAKGKDFNGKPEYKFFLDGEMQAAGYDSTGNTSPPDGWPDVFGTASTLTPNGPEDMTSYITDICALPCGTRRDIQQEMNRLKNKAYEDIAKKIY